MERHFQSMSIVGVKQPDKNQKIHLLLKIWRIMRVTCTDYPAAIQPRKNNDRVREGELERRGTRVVSLVPKLKLRREINGSPRLRSSSYAKIKHAGRNEDSS